MADVTAEQLGELARLRDAIDQQDQGILDLLSARRALSRRLQRLKVYHGFPSVDLGREKRVRLRYFHRFGPGGADVADEILGLCKEDVTP